MKKLGKVVVLLAFLSGWIFLTKLNLVKPIFLPPLPEVIVSLKSIILSIDGIKNILFTLRRAIISFFIGSLIGISVGVTLGLFNGVYEYIEGFIDFFRSVPVSAMFPLFLIFFGFEDCSKIAMGAWATGFIIIVNTIHGIRNTKKNRRIMAQIKKATTFQIITKITLPESLPSIFAGLKIGISWNLIVIIVAEMIIGTRYGIGHMIYDASVMLETADVIAGIIIIGSIGLATNYLLDKVEHKVVHWTGQ